MVAIIVGIVGIISLTLQQLDTETIRSDIIQTDTGEYVIQTDEGLVEIDKSKLKKAPQIAGIAHYINTTPEQLQTQIKDSVVLYDIWTYSCINCVRTLPYITAWNDKYADQGLLIIGIHSPEFEFEKDLDNVKTAVAKHGITYPVALDNDWDTWNAFENRYWPRKYIADHQGYIRYDHIGEGGYAETEKVIQQLLKERSASLGIGIASATALVDIDEFEHTRFRTPELYFGYELALPSRDNLGSPEGFKPGNQVTYSTKETLEQDKFYLQGTWENNSDHMKLISEGGVIQLPYTAKQVNIVADGHAEIEITIDGEQISPEIAGTDIINGKLVIDGPALYNLIDAKSSSSHLIEMTVEKSGFELYTFTFG